MALKKSQTPKDMTAATETPEHHRQRPRDLPGLIAELSDPDPQARRWAARDLALTHDSRASEALVRQLRHETEPAVQEAIIWTLMRLRDTTAVQGLIACLRSDDAFVRNAAIDALKELPDAVAPVMAGLLTDPDPDVRIFAINVLESLRHPDVERWLLEVIEDEEHVNVIATAVDLLGEVGTQAAIAPLERLQARFADEPYLAFAIGLALKRLREG